MSVVSIWPYFALMGWFICLGALLSRKAVRGGGAASGARYSVPLESLRGLLALSVFFHHAVTTYFHMRTRNWPTPPSTFYFLLASGPVTLFFFLSGYLFWSRCLQKGEISDTAAFYSTRARRILPAYYVTLPFVIGLAFCFTGFTLRDSPLQVAGEILAWMAMALPYGTFPRINGYPETLFTDAGVPWTLRYEVIFYASLPFLSRRARGHWTLFWLTLWGSSYELLEWFATRPYYPGGPFLRLAHGLSRYFFVGFGFGMLAAYLQSLLPERFSRLARSPAFAVVALLVLVLHFYANPPTYSVEQSLFLLVPFLAVALGNDFFGFLSLRPMEFLGRISYSIYVVHGLILFSLSHLINHWIQFQSLGPWIFWCFVCLAGTLAICISAGMYHSIELPWMRRRAASRKMPLESAMEAALVTPASPLSGGGQDPTPSDYLGGVLK